MKTYLPVGNLTGIDSEFGFGRNFDLTCLGWKAVVNAQGTEDCALIEKVR